MSQNHAVKRDHYDAGLKSLDLLFALLLHVLVLSIIGTLVYWQQQHRIEPLKRIEVMMISAKQLAKLEQQSHRKAKPVKHKQIKAKPKPKKLAVKPKPKPKPKKPVVKLKPKAAPKPVHIDKPKPAKKPAAKKTTTKVEDNFDPFAPLASTTDRATPTKKASTSRPELANLMGKQLSSSEKERYIALMQAAVQQHWKLAISSAKFTDPLVEMQLFPSGAVASVKILESSGNNALDASLIRAIKAAAPFELPRQQFEFFRVNRIRFHPLK
ncbi:MAG: TonB family protein [Mariprofundus sp.]|nr:TonB family protein [Mariprofundus sp.]